MANPAPWGTTHRRLPVCNVAIRDNGFGIIEQTAGLSETRYGSAPFPKSIKALVRLGRSEAMERIGNLSLWDVFVALSRTRHWAALAAVIIAVGLCSAPAHAQSGGTVYLLLHGLNSDETAWNPVVKKLFNNNCPTLREETDARTLVDSRCYRFHFSDTTWPNGDGLTLRQLGDEVDRAIRKIEANIQPSAMVLIAHSRGGLAARAYLQQPSAMPAFKIALLTIGTPHQGSPFGRVKPFMDQNGVGIDDVRETVNVEYQGVPTPITVRARDRLRFVFSPSMDFLATEPASYRGQIPCDTRQNQALCNLNAEVEQLRTHVTAFGQMLSRGLVLGDETPLEEGVTLDLLGNASLKELMPQFIPKLNADDFIRMREYVLSGITGTISKSGNFCSKTKNPNRANWAWSTRNENSWACNGDGIVPYLSQRLSILLPSASIASLRLSEVYHTQETGQTRNINKLLKSMFGNHGEFQLP